MSSVQLLDKTRKIGKHVFFAVLAVQILSSMSGTLIVFDILSSVMLAMTTYIFYKIFVSSSIFKISLNWFCTIFSFHIGKSKIDNI